MKPAKRISAREQAKYPANPLGFAPISIKVERETEYVMFCYLLGGDVPDDTKYTTFLRLWMYVAEFHIWGEIPHVPAEILAHRCQWKSDPDLLLSALLESGLLVDEGDHWWLLWWDHFALHAPLKRTKELAKKRSKPQVRRKKATKQPLRVVKERSKVLACSPGNTLGNMGGNTPSKLGEPFARKVQVKDQDLRSLPPPHKTAPPPLESFPQRAADPARSPREVAPGLAAKGARREKPELADVDVLLSRQVKTTQKQPPKPQLAAGTPTAMALQGATGGLGEPQVLEATPSLGEAPSDAPSAPLSRKQMVDLFCVELGVCLDSTIKSKELRIMADLAGKVSREEAMDAHHDASIYAAGRSEKAGLPLILLKLKGMHAERTAKSSAPAPHKAAPGQQTAIKRYSPKQEAFKLRQEKNDLHFLQEAARAEADKKALKAARGAK